MTEKNDKQTFKFRGAVFLPPFLLLVSGVILSIIWPEAFIKSTNTINSWVLDNFDWLFNWSSFLFLILITFIYFSPISKIIIGGKGVKPILTKWRWFSITLCTTIATGILFWGTAEPMFHANETPGGIQDGETFAMSTMYMHWTFTPYGIYTITGLMFALSYYNLKQPFSLSSLLYPLIGNKVHNSIGLGVDSICLFALVAGMAASMGTGIMALSGGMNLFFQFKPSSLIYACIAILIVSVFVISASSGLHKGIRLLSSWNIGALILLAIFVFITGPTREFFTIGGQGLIDYVTNFVSRSTGVGSGLESTWVQSWTSFYWATWFAWAPISALFLGRIAYGYTVKEFIHFNLIFPSLFSGFWMVIFSGSTLVFDEGSNHQIYAALQSDGPQAVIYELFEFLPFSSGLSFAFIIIAFLSYVTAADSNISAMSSISVKGVSPENPEAPVYIKIMWGVIVGTVSWVMISFAGIDGIKMISTIGGFPALFLIIAVALGFLKLIFGRDKKLEGN